MTRRGHLTLAGFALTAVLACSADAAQTPPAVAPTAAPATGAADTVRTELNQQTFDAVWAIIRDTHWDPTINGLDWTAVREELLPKAMAAKTDDELRGVLRAMLARLKQSHFAILPGEQVLESLAPHKEPAKAPTAPAGAPEAQPPAGETGPPAAEAPRAARKSNPRGGTTGARVTLLMAPTLNAAGLEAVVTSVRAGSSAEKAGLIPGAVVLAVNGSPLTQALPAGSGPQRYERGAIARARVTGEPGTRTTWKVRMPDNRMRDIEMEFLPDTRPKASLAGLPPASTELEWKELDAEFVARFGAAGARIGTIRFDTWLPAINTPFNEAIDTLRTADGIVIDLRGNPGGLAGMIMGVSGHFTPKKERLGVMRTRDSEMKFNSNPRLTTADNRIVPVYGGSLAILVDDGTASTSEIFAGGMQYLKRARIFGMPTAGAALPSTFDELPNGDVFMHAIADYRLPDGRALEATGVQPDLQRTYTSDDYARDGDPVLTDAIRWIGTERAARTKEQKP